MLNMKCSTKWINYSKFLVQPTKSVNWQQNQLLHIYNKNITNAARIQPVNLKMKTPVQFYNVLLVIIERLKEPAKQKALLFN